MPARPPLPGTFTAPNLLAIEEAVAQITFPISKRELVAEVEGKTVFFGGRNVDLQELIRDLNDDYFESEEEFHSVLQDALANRDADTGDEHAPTQPGLAWNEPAYGQDHGAADMAEYGDTTPHEPTR